MDKREAIKFLKQYLAEITELRELQYDNQTFKLWTLRVVNVIEEGLEQKDLDTFTAAHREDNTIYATQPGVTSLPYSKFYQEDINAKETALKSIIHRYEDLGHVSNDEANISEKHIGKTDMQTYELLIKSSKSNWKAIKAEFGITKTSFGKRINFIKDPFNRKIIFRDVEQAYILASSGFSKPAVILAGSVIEELLRQYLKHNNIPPLSDNFNEYIKTCEKYGLLKNSVSRLSDSTRQFRNLVHIAAEKTKKHTITKATAIGAVSSIFTIANDF